MITKQVLMSSGSEEGLLQCLCCYLGGDYKLVGSEWPKGVSNGVRVVEGLQAIKKGKKHIRFQIVRRYTDFIKLYEKECKV